MLIVQRPQIEEVEVTETRSRFVVEPLEPVTLPVTLPVTFPVKAPVTLPWKLPSIASM